MDAAKKSNGGFFKKEKNLQDRANTQRRAIECTVQSTVKTEMELRWHLQTKKTTRLQDRQMWEANRWKTFEKNKLSVEKRDELSSFISTRVNQDHTGRGEEKCFFQHVLDSELHIYSPLLFLPLRLYFPYQISNVSLRRDPFRSMCVCLQVFRNVWPFVHMVRVVKP